MKTAPPKYTPPKLALCFFRWYCHPEFTEDIEGDLQEIFEERVERLGATKARLLYYIDVLVLFRPSLIRFFTYRQSFSLHTAMFKNYIYFGLRNIWTHKHNTVLNMFGLSIGMSAFLLILIYVRFESSYDNFHAKGDRIYRLKSEIYQDNARVRILAQTYPAVGPALKSEYPEVEEFCRLFPVGGGALISFQEHIFNEDNVYFSDASFFHMFSFPMIASQTDTLLKNPNTLVLTASLAAKYFGELNPLGQTMQFNWFGNTLDFIVEGVVADPPQNSHLKFTVLLSYPTLYELSRGDSENSWGWSNFYTYLLLSPNASPALLAEKLEGFSKKHIQSEQKQDKFYLQPLESIHLHSRLSDELEKNGDAGIVQWMIIIAFFILAIAWINYINVSVAKSVDRAKEVAVRKMNGATHAQLVMRFLVEAFILNLLAMLLTMVILIISILYFSEFIGVKLSLQIFSELWLWLALTAVLVIGSFSSGLYPALIISSFKPISFFSKNLKSKGNFFRNVLVILQYGIAAFLIIGIITVYQQISFVRNKDMGFSMNNILVVKGPKNANQETYLNSFHKFKNEINSYASVSSFTASSIVPGLPLIGILQYVRPLNTPEEEAQTYYGVNVDHHFFETYRINFLAGTNFSENATEHSSIILSEKAVALLGFSSPEEAVHQKIIGPSNTEMEVIGVVENYHQLSPQNDYYPSYYTLLEGASMQTFYSIKFDNAENVQALINFLEDQWKINFPENAFEYFFLDDFFDQQFKEDLQFRRVLSAFTLIAIIITCIGLFAMVLYQIARKTKEIGIRKVLGASVESILILFSRDFIRLIVIANIIAWPIAYISLQAWLTDFAFKIDIQWGWIFIISLCALIVISLLTVSIHILKAAMANPVNSLRHE